MWLHLVWPPLFLGLCYSVLYCRSQSKWSCNFPSPGFPKTARPGGQSYSAHPAKTKWFIVLPFFLWFFQCLQKVVLSELWPQPQDCSPLSSTGNWLRLYRRSSGTRQGSRSWREDTLRDWTRHEPQAPGPALRETRKVVSLSVKVHSPGYTNYTTVTQNN